MILWVQTCRSKRKTSSQVAFVNGDRLLGEEAAVLQPRFPDRVFTSVRFGQH